MKSIEERIVSMQFDNKQFEKGAKQSIDTLDKLNKSLEFKGASENLKKLQEESKHFSLESIAKNVDDLSNRFSNFGIIGMTVLQDITRSAISTGKQVVSALTIDPQKMGFQEYETQINAIQTIMANTASKGTTIDQINDTLDELNLYADKTIYNFTQMTENIGRFTAAGLDLNISSKAIQGLSNLAASAGSNTMQLNSAMYQLSQALATGVIKLMDWNSIVNAGMGGEMLQESLMETARVHGINIDAMIEKNGSFRDTLQEGWLTSEIMMETLLKFTGNYSKEQWIAIGYTEEQADAIVELGKTAMSAATDVKTFTQLIDTLKESLQSGWTQSWEYIFGDFEEAKSLFSEIYAILSTVINNSAESRNAVLKSWKDLGGRTAIIDGLRNTFHALYKVIAPIKEAFTDIFPPMTGETLAEISKAFRDLTERLIITDEQSQWLKNTFTTFFSFIKTGIDILSAFADSLTPLLGVLSVLQDVVLNAGNGVADFASGLVESANKSKKITDVFAYLKTVFSDISLSVTNFYESLKTKIDFSVFSDFQNFLLNAKSSVVNFATIAVSSISKVGGTAKEQLGPAAEAFEFINSIIEKVTNTFNELKNKISSFVSPIADRIKKAFKGITIVDIIGTGSLTAIVLFVRKFVKSLNEISVNFNDVLKSINETLDTVRESLEAWQNSLKADMLLKIASAVGILTLALIGMSFVDGDKLKAGLLGVSILLGEVVATLKVLDGFTGKTINTGALVAELVAMGVAMNLLALALAKISTINGDNLIMPIFAMVSMMQMLSNSVESINGFNTTRAASTLIAVGTAMYVMAEGLTKIGQLNASSIIYSTFAVVSMLKVLSQAITSMNGVNIAGTATSIIAIGVSIYTLATAVEKFALLYETSQGFIVGFASVAGLIVGLTSALGTLQTANIKGVAVSMLALGISLQVLYSAVEKFALLYETSQGFLVGFASVAGLIAGLSAAIGTIQTANMSGVAVSLIALSAGMLLLYSAVEKFALLYETSQGFLVGFASIAGLIVGLTSALGPLASANMSGVAVSLLALSAALTMLTIPLAVLSGIAWPALAIGVASLLVAFAGIGVVATLLTPFSAGILAVAGAFAIFGVAITGIGGGIALLSLGLAGLATSAVAGASALVVAIPIIGQALEQLLQSVYNVLHNSGPVISGIIGELIVIFLNTLVEYGPTIVAKLWELVKWILHGISVLIFEELGPAFLELLNFILNSIGGFFEPMVEAGKNVVMGFVSGILGVPYAVTDAVAGLGSSVIEGLKDFLGIHSPSRETMSLGEYTAQGFVEGITSSLGDIATAGKNMGVAADTALRDYMGIHSNADREIEAGKFTGGGLIEGIESTYSGVRAAGEGLANQAAGGIQSQLSKNLLEIKNEKSITDAAKDWVKSFTETSNSELEEETSNSLADLLSQFGSSGTSAGQSFSRGAASGIKKEKSPEEAAAEKANEIKEAFSKELDAISLDIKTSQLELELWKTQNELVLDEEEYYVKQKEQLNKEITLQTEKTNKANEKYLKMVETFGESSEYAQEAYNEWLEEQKSLAELSNELATLVEENADNIVEAYDAMNSALDRQMSKNDINEQIGDQFRPELESLKDTKEEVDRLKEELDAGWEEYNKIKEEYADDPEAMQEQLDALTPDLYEKQEEYYAALEKLEDLEPKVAVKYFTETARSMRKYYLQAEKVNTSLDKYNALLADSEASQEDIEQAYNDYLQARKDLLDISSEYADTIELDENGKIILNSFANALGENWYLVSDELGELMDGLSPIIEESNLPDSFKRMLQKFFDDPSLGTLLSAALSELLKLVLTNIDFGAILKSLFNGDVVAGIATAVSTIFGGLGEVFGGIGAFIVQALDMIGPVITAFFASTGPVGIVLAVIAAIGVAFVVAWNKSEKFRDFVTKAFNKIKEVALAVFEALKTAWTTVMNVMLAPVKLIISAIEAVINGVKKMIAFLRGEELETDVNVNTGSSGDNAEKEGASLGDKLVSGISGALSGAAVGGILLGPIGAIGGAIIGGFKSVFDIHSPSRVTAEIGKMLVSGLNKGIEDNTYTTRYATDNYGKEVMKSLANTFDNIDNISEPTIRPVMDLSNIRKGATEMDSLISRKARYDISGNVSSVRKASASLENQNGDNFNSSSKASSGTSYNFTQNNYSPKALSKSEIYRQTRNQFSTLKGLVEN